MLYNSFKTSFIASSTNLSVQDSEVMRSVRKCHVTMQHGGEKYYRMKRHRAFESMQKELDMLYRAEDSSLQRRIVASMQQPSQVSRITIQRSYD
jgi:hypothetical protein